MISASFSRMSSESPRSVSVGACFDLSSRRLTTDSPSTVGSVATRMSSMRPAAAAFSEMRPSCGFRRSAMSSFASTFKRVVTPAIIRLGIRCTSWSTPSMRSRTASASSCGSKWMSLAPSSAAWKMIEFTSRTNGTSEMPSSASRSSISSSASGNPPSSSSTARAPKASDARMRRRTSAWMSSREATPISSEYLVASRSSSIAWTLPGSATATRRTLPSIAYGTASIRSSTCSGKSWTASSLTPTSGRSTNGTWKRLASVRAIPSGDATPSSSTACENAAPCFARPRTCASLSAGISPVVSTRAPTSSASSLTGNDAGSCPPSAPFFAPDRPEVRSFGGRFRSTDPSNEVSAETRRKLSLERAQIGAEELVARKQRHDRAERQERRECDPHLPRSPPVPGEQHDARDQREQHAEHQPDRDQLAEHCAEQERELHVPHAHPGRVGEGGDEQEARGAERAERPRRAGIEQGVPDQHDRGRREHDPVRDDPVRQVGRGDRDEHRAEEGAQDRDPGQPEDDEAGGDEAGRRELDRGIQRADPRPARAALPAQEEVGKDGHVVVPGQLGPAAHAGRARLDDRAPQRHARRDDVHEAAERERRPEREHTESKVHLRIIGGRRSQVEG